MTLEWMAWTPITGGFFVAIALMLAGMTVWQILSPTVERRGMLPIRTTRGDRLFIGLLGSAYICIAWLFLFKATLWYALPLILIFIVLVMWIG
jgi:predicted small integral membrane protein